MGLSPPWGCRPWSAIVKITPTTGTSIVGNAYELVPWVTMKILRFCWMQFSGIDFLLRSFVNFISQLLGVDVHDREVCVRIFELLGAAAWKKHRSFWRWFFCVTTNVSFQLSARFTKTRADCFGSKIAVETNPDREIAHTKRHLYFKTDIAWAIIVCSFLRPACNGCGISSHPCKTLENGNSGTNLVTYARKRVNTVLLCLPKQSLNYCVQDQLFSPRNKWTYLKEATKYVEKPALLPTWYSNMFHFSIALVCADSLLTNGTTTFACCCLLIESVDHMQARKHTQVKCVHEKQLKFGLRHWFCGEWQTKQTFDEKIVSASQRNGHKGPLLSHERCF